MHPFSRRAAPPEHGWFQIGEMPQQLPPRRRGQGRVSLSATQHDPATTSAPQPTPKRRNVLVRANEAATSTLERIIDYRYGALALCVTAVLVVLIAAVVIATLATELRASRAQLASAGIALTQTAGPHHTTTGPGNETPKRKD